MRTVARPTASLRLAATAWLVLTASPAVAQGDCETALQAAEKSYGLGLFEDVPAALEPCIKGRASRAETVRAYALLAKAYLAVDAMQEAREAVAEILRIDSTYEAGPPPRFAALVAEVRRSEAELQVATVSKTSESLRAAPATVVVIRAEEIARRGYLDLEQVLHDLPGFDVSRGNGETYSTFYQRGFRSNDNDRILLLVDGVEQNDLATGVAHLSRQYPVSTVERIEVVYGPASTIYGANAYSGVINIITKPAEAFISPGKRFGTLIQAASGTFNTRATDLTFAGQDRSGSVAWSVTGRLFRSDEMDLSGFPGWQYDFAAVPYKDRLRLEGEDAQEFCFEQPFECGRLDPDDPEPLVEVSYDEEGTAQVVNLTDAGERLARRLDQAVGLAFSDRTEDWSLYAKLRLANLTVGLQAWSLEEGTAPWYNGNDRARHAPATWAPEHRSLFVKYARSLGKSLSLNLFTRYRQSDLDAEISARGEIFTYFNGTLNLFDLAGSGCGLPGSPFLTRPCPSHVEGDAPRQLATQSAAELTLVYSPRRQFTLVSGFDLKKGSVQTRQERLFGFNIVDQVVDHTDLGLYAQASYKPFPPLSLVAGGRVDYNEASSPDFPDAGFGARFSPRLALVYFRARYGLKVIYSEAFKDPSDLEKLSEEESASGSSTIPRLANPDLRPERTRSFELSVGWYPHDGASVELSAYRTLYDDLVDVARGCQFRFALDGQENPFEPCPPDLAVYRIVQQFQNLVDMEVQGVELRADTHLGRVALFGNATYIDPRGTTILEGGGPRSRARTGDIASHRANLGIELPLWKKTDFHLRWNYVGARRTGEGTTVSTNPLRQIDGYSTASATLSYRDLLPGTTVQLVVNNLFDTAYEHPGVFTADGEDFAASIPQPGRTVYARVTWGLGRSREAPRENQ